MLTIKNTENFRIEKPSIVTIGTFDGVHLGHQKILKKLNELKQAHGLNIVVLTFDPHPRKVLFPAQTDLQLITTTEEKLSLLKTYGVDIAVVYPFSLKFAQMEATAYVKDILVKSLKVKHLAIGYDHKFGKNRDGNINTLRSYAQEFNYQVEEISAQDIDSINVSSSKIRHALAEGNVELAHKYLGHAFSLTGTVVTGKQLGRTIGYPTANIQIEEAEKLIPLSGVYFVSLLLGSEHYYGMLNIGKNPTTDTDDTIKIEVNIFNFKEEIYGRTLKIDFLKRLRDGIKFKNIDELKTQLGIDKETCLHLIEQLKTHA